MKMHSFLQQGSRRLSLILLALFFITLPGVCATLDEDDPPAIYQAYLNGVCNGKGVQLHLRYTHDNFLEGEYVSHAHKKAKSLKGTYSNGVFHLEPRYGTPQESFDLRWGNGNQSNQLFGKWKRGTQVLNMRFKLQASLIEPSQNEECPFVGEWEARDQGIIVLQMSLYQQDLKGDCALFLLTNDKDSDPVRRAYYKDIIILNRNIASFSTPGFYAEVYPNREDGSMTLSWSGRGEFRLQPRKVRIEDFSFLAKMSQAERNAYFQEEQLAIRKMEEEKESLAMTPAPVASRTSVSDTDDFEEISMDGLDEEPAHDTKPIDNSIVEIPARFPGGEMALMKYIGENVDYPKKAIKEEIQGTVWVRFAIEHDGSIGDIQITKGLHPLLDKAAHDVILSLPRFIPAKQQGKPVRVFFNCPIRFMIG